MTSNPISDNARHYITVVNDGAMIHLYLDGKDTGQTLASDLATDNFGWYLGAQHFYQGGANNFHQGLIDEFRFSTAPRTTDLIATEYNNQSAPTAFLGVSAENVPISIVPATAGIYAAQTQQFTATVNSCSTGAVTWSVTPTTGAGSIDSSGVYTAPAPIAVATPDTITATSQADATVIGTASITLYPPVSLTVTPYTANAAVGQPVQFTANVINALDTSVKWPINPAFGAISATGLYTAPTGIAGQIPVTIKAVSTVDPTKSATATVILSRVAAAPVISCAAQVRSVNSPSSQILMMAGFPAGARSAGRMILVSSTTRIRLCRPSVWRGVPGGPRTPR